MTKRSHAASLPSELAAAPYIDQYFGAWALWEPKFQALVDCAENINIQLHLEQHVHSEAAPAAATGMMAVDGAPSVSVTRDGIALIEIRGTLMKQASSFSGGASTVRLRRQVRAAAASDDVSGILLVFDTPGGTVAGTADLAADIRAAGHKKPVWAYIEDLCASAGYWHAAQTQRIAAGDSAITGSIGVFSVVTDVSKKAEADGRQVHVIRFGKFKGAGVPGTEITEEQLARWQRLVDAHGEDFVATVAAGRRLSVERVRDLADGDVHKGEAAKKLGLVDAIESFDDTLAALVRETKKPRSSVKGTRMSQDTTAAATEPQTPKAATLAELREGCPGASSEFLLSQLEATATIAQAMKAHAKQLADEKAALVKERDELKAAAGKQRGLPPIGGQADEAAEDKYDGLSANEFMRCKIAERVEKGFKRDQAAKSVFAAYPDLQGDVLREANERPRR